MSGSGLLDGVNLEYEPSAQPRLTFKKRIKLFFKKYSL